MDIRISKTDLDGVVVIEPQFFQDHRGFFFESYNKRRLAEKGFDITFVQDNHSRSAKGVLRGLHYQNMKGPLHRLMRCTIGEIWYTVVDLRVGAPTFGKWFATTLSAENKKQVLIAPEFAHGFVVMSDVAEVQYKLSGYHDPAADAAIAWDDPDIGIPWPVKEPILSDRDRQKGVRLKDYLRDPSFKLS